MQDKTITMQDKTITMQELKEEIQAAERRLREDQNGILDKQPVWTTEELKILEEKVQLVRIW